MEIEKKKRGRPPKHKTSETTGMTYDGAINYTLDREVKAELDKSLADKNESTLTEDERKYLNAKREKKSYTLNIRFTESEMQDIISKCEQFGYKNKTEYIRDCVRARVDLTVDRAEFSTTNRLMKAVGNNINQIAIKLHSTGNFYEEDMSEIKRGVNQIWQLLLSIQSRQQSQQQSVTSQTEIRPSTVLYVSSYACRADSRGASEDFRTVRATGTGRTKILAHHIIQSFEPGEITPEQALQIGEELCDRLLKGDYQYVLAVHTNKNHLHCHIIFNNTNLYNGLSFTTEHNQGKVSERSWAKVRAISDEICKEHGLYVIEPKGKGISHFERDMQIQGKSWKDKLRAKIAEVAFYSKSFEDFLRRCAECGIEYVYKPQNKVKLKFRLKDEGQQKFTRADTLGEDYTPERIAEQIEHIQKALAVTDKFAEKKATEKPITSPIMTTTDPTKNKAPEKEETVDGWASIRGMNNSAQIIAELESVGIHSVGEFTYFNMQASKDISDISEKLAVLKKQIGSIDTLISKMKQRAELSVTYKEYQGLSGLKQRRFKKKNTDAIDSYEQTNKYIKERIKVHKVDGKTPTIAELKERSQTMKDEYNDLLRERKVLEKKHAVTSQYSRTVRNYINQQTNKRAAEQSRQRRLSQQKKKDTLE